MSIRLSLASPSALHPLLSVTKAHHEQPVWSWHKLSMAPPEPSIAFHVKLLLAEAQLCDIWLAGSEREVQKLSYAWMIRKEKTTLKEMPKGTGKQGFITKVNPSVTKLTYRSEHGGGNSAHSASQWNLPPPRAGPTRMSQTGSSNSAYPCRCWRFSSFFGNKVAKCHSNLSVYSMWSLFCVFQLKHKILESLIAKYKSLVIFPK